MSDTPIIQQLKSIDIDEQINRINNVYQIVFKNQSTNIKKQFEQFLFNKQSEDKCIVLTSVVYDNHVESLVLERALVHGLAVAKQLAVIGLNATSLTVFLRTTREACI